MRLSLLVLLVAACRTGAPAAGGAGPDVGGGGVTAPSLLPDNLLAVAITATSTLPGKPDDVAPWRVFDPDAHDTHWCEDDAGDGTGQSLTLRFDAPALVQRVIVNQGDAHLVAPHTYGRVTAFTIRTNDGRALASSDYPDGGLYAHLGQPLITELTITIAAVDTQRGGTVACLGDVELDGLQGRRYQVIADVPAAALDALPAALPAIAGALERCDEAALPEFVAFPLPYRRGLEEGVYADLDGLMTACRATVGPRLNIEPAAALAALGQEHAGELVVDAGDDHSWHLAWRDAGWRLIRTGIR